jgi:hypothetical protein
MEPWTNHDAVAWRRFLESPIGTRLIEAYRAHLPRIGGNTMEGMALSGARYAGQQEGMAVLYRLAQGSPPTEDELAYPNT